MASYDLTAVREGSARFLQRLFDPRSAALPRWLDRNLDVYVTCFCENGDLLSQWRAYAGRDDAGGYALGLGTDPPMQGWPQNSPTSHEVALRRVLYDPVEQEAACHDLIDALVPILDEDPEDAERQRSFARNLVNGVVEFASWCKDPAFEEEQEWRIVYVRNNDSSKLEIRHRLARGLLVPYVELRASLSRRAVGRTPAAAVHQPRAGSGACPQAAGCARPCSPTIPTSRTSRLRGPRPPCASDADAATVPAA